MAQAAEGGDKGLAAATARLAAYEARPGEEEPPGVKVCLLRLPGVVDMCACSCTVLAGPPDISFDTGHINAAGSDGIQY